LQSVYLIPFALYCFVVEISLLVIGRKKPRLYSVALYGGDGGSRTRVQTGISTAYYSLSDVVLWKEKDTGEIHPSYPLE